MLADSDCFLNSRFTVFMYSERNRVKQSAKTNLNVEEVFFSRAKDIKQRLADSDTKAEPSTIKINQPDPAGIAGQAAQKSGCCN
ncbi:hypothetical protein E1A91_A05G374800v1 [Gossypium mustelinum]|uniref:Uncharacterized protein n=1 Tax=Gossypium mustelinum TaxID=34275 RepID=A0A5D2ZGL4_GOSMU|nr:hypothetical protein E1A91_A05G374800v1 [Gossypium mustelinum]